MSETIDPSTKAENQTFKGRAMRILRYNYTPAGELVAFFPMRIQREDGSSARRDVYLSGALNINVAARISTGMQVMVEGVEYTARKIDADGRKIKSGKRIAATTISFPNE